MKEKKISGHPNSIARRSILSVGGGRLAGVPRPHQRASVAGYCDSADRDRGCPREGGHRNTLSMLAAVPLLGEPIAPYHIVGGVLVIGGTAPTNQHHAVARVHAVLPC